LSTLVVSGADEAFAPLLIDLVDSVNANAEGLVDAVGLLDVGLSEATRQRLRPKMSAIVEPEWDFVVDAALKREKPHLRALLSRPLLQKYFPGYDRYVWMDADTWLQEGYALRWLVRAARHGAIALVPHLDRSYVRSPGAREWKMARLNALFPGLLPPGLETTYNAGVFCMEANAPHWASWAKYMTIALANSPRMISDQTVLNYAIRNENLAFHPLPALCNWCCHLAVPRVVRGRLCEPYVPHTPIGIIHLSGRGAKDASVRYWDGERPMARSLRYGATPFPVPAPAAAP
jgi:hypothetical protein